MSDDIVARLYKLTEMLDEIEWRDELVTTSEAAAEIERLRAERDGYLDGNRQTLAALAEANEIAKKYKAERDEARQEICLLRASSTNATEKVSFEMIAYAASRGWEDLFADEGKHERDA